MEECVKVKVLKSGKLQESVSFDNYDKALDYAIKKVELGNVCLVLRKVENVWVKVWLNPSETI